MCSSVPVAAQRRAMFPVLGGISGSYSATCIAGKSYTFKSDPANGFMHLFGYGVHQFSQKPVNYFSVWPGVLQSPFVRIEPISGVSKACRSEEHTSELQSPCNLVCR